MKDVYREREREIHMYINCNIILILFFFFLNLIDNKRRIDETNMNLNETNMDISNSMENLATAVVPATTPPSTDNMNHEGVVGGEEEDQSRAEATFKFTVNDFSKFKESKESKLSSPCIVRNLPWKILVLNKQGNSREESKSLGFFLQCNADSEST